MPKDGMSFDKYIDNPSGGSVYTNRNMYKQMYRKKFDAVLVREQGQIKYEIYKTDDGNDSFFIYIKIPSEVIENFYYDVVVKLFTYDNVKKTNANLREYSVNFYSNDPAFVYTFAHSFAKNKLFIKELEPKMSKQALRDKAVVRNPKDDVWYVKSLYFAYLTMEKYGLFNRSMLNQRSKPYRKNELLQKITQADVKVKARQDAQEKLNKEKRLAKEKEKKENQKKINSGIATNTSRAAPISKVAKTTKVSSTSRVTKKTKITSMKKKS